MESALSIKGQATIPKVIRDHLQLQPGDRIKFFVQSGRQRGDPAEDLNVEAEGHY